MIIDPYVELYNGHVVDVLKSITDNSIDMCMTSPPFYGLRVYGTEQQIWGAWKGELGSEPSIGMYVEHLMIVFDEIKRVLKKKGLFFLNIADSYAGSGKGIGGDRDKSKEVFPDNVPKTNWGESNVIAKSLCAIPERIVISMSDRGMDKKKYHNLAKEKCYA
jgi:DNA modification methylase